MEREKNQDKENAARKMKAQTRFQTKSAFVMEEKFRMKVFF
jgi:hypothetical protein